MHLLTNAIVVTMDPGRRVFERGYVAIEGGLIQSVGPVEDAPRAGKGVRVRDLSGMIVMPGLVNTHDHPCASLLRATGRGMVLEEWIPRVALPMVGALWREAIEFGGKYQAVELLLSGTTTCLIHAVNCNDSDSFECLFRGGSEVGLRQVVTKEIRGAPKVPIVPEAKPAAYPRSLDEDLKLAELMVSRWDGEEGGLLRVGFAVEAGATWLLGGATSEACIVESNRLAMALGALITCHISSTERLAHRRFLDVVGYGEVEHLQRLGALSKQWIFAHGLHLSDDEISLVGEAGAAVAHCPVSNAYSADGIARVPRLREAGVRIGLGTDGSYVCGRADMFEVMKFCFLLQNVVRQDPGAVSAEEALEMATLGGARVLGLEREIGSLEVGKRADLICLEMRRPGVWPITDLIGSIVCAFDRGTVADVYVGGRRVVQNGKVEGVDEDRLVEEAVHYSEQLLRKANLGWLRRTKWSPKTWQK